MLNWILIALIAWPIVGFAIVYGYSVIKAAAIMVSRGADADKVFETLKFVMKRDEGKKVDLAKSRFLDISFTDRGMPDNEHRKAVNKLWSILEWPIIALWMRRLLRETDTVLAKQ